MLYYQIDYYLSNQILFTGAQRNILALTTEWTSSIRPLARLLEAQQVRAKLDLVDIADPHSCDPRPFLDMKQELDV